MRNPPQSSSPTPPIRTLEALGAALLEVGLVDLGTNNFPINWENRWDPHHYLEMARHGLIENPSLVAPFAYRPAMPLMARGLSVVLPLSPEEAFFWLTRFFAVLFLMVLYRLAYQATQRHGSSLGLMTLMGCYFASLKVPLYFSSMVDIAAYPVFGLCFEWLIAGYITRAGLLAVIGLSFKEFLGVPWLISCVLLFRRRQWRHSALVLAGGLLMILCLRCLIPVTMSAQFIDPWSNPASLSKLYAVFLDPGRLFNLLYANLVFWLPSLLLIRSIPLTSGPQPTAIPPLLLAAGGLIELLALYGGTNLTIFVSYLFPLEIFVLSRGLMAHPGRLPWVLTLLIVAGYNRLLMAIPSPAESLEVYLDFWGGFDSRVNRASLIKALELGATLLVGRTLIMKTIKKAP